MRRQQARHRAEGRLPAPTDLLPLFSLPRAATTGPVTVRTAATTASIRGTRRTSYRRRATGAAPGDARWAFIVSLETPSALTPFSPRARPAGNNTARRRLQLEQTDDDTPFDDPGNSWSNVAADAVQSLIPVVGFVAAAADAVQGNFQGAKKKLSRAAADAIGVHKHIKGKNEKRKEERQEEWERQKRERKEEKEKKKREKEEKTGDTKTRRIHDEG